MGLAVQQKSDDGHNADIRHKAVAQGLHLIVIFVDKCRKEYDEADLCQLGGLELDTGKDDPALGEVSHDTEKLDSHKGKHRKREDNKPVSLQPSVVKAGNDQHQPEANKGQGRLVKNIIGRGIMVAQGQRVTCLMSYR